MLKLMKIKLNKKKFFYLNTFKKLKDNKLKI